MDIGHHGGAHADTEVTPSDEDSKQLSSHSAFPPVAKKGQHLSNSLVIVQAEEAGASVLQWAKDDSSFHIPVVTTAGQKDAESFLLNAFQLVAGEMRAGQRVGNAGEVITIVEGSSFGS